MSHACVCLNILSASYPDCQNPVAHTLRVFDGFVLLITCSYMNFKLGVIASTERHPFYVCLQSHHSWSCAQTFVSLWMEGQMKSCVGCVDASASKHDTDI